MRGGACWSARAAVRLTHQPACRDCGPRRNREPAEANSLRVISPPLPRHRGLCFGARPGGVRWSAEHFPEVPVRHGDLGDDDRQDKHRLVGGRNRPCRSGHMEDQGDHGDDGSDGRLSRQEPCDARGPCTPDATVNTPTGLSPVHATDRTKCVTTSQLAVPENRPASLLSRALVSCYPNDKTSLTTPRSSWAFRETARVR